MKLIVASRADEASMNIRSALLKNYGFKKKKVKRKMADCTGSKIFC
jgi:hypothetical protein